MVSRRSGLPPGAWLAALLWLARAASAEPRIHLKIDGFADADFANFSTVVIPMPEPASATIWLDGAMESIQHSTVRVTLNGSSMIALSRILSSAGGVGVVVPFRRTLNPEQSLQPERENVLDFSASDIGKVTYQGRFYLMLDGRAKSPRSISVRDTPPMPEVVAPAQPEAPVVKLRGEWPEQTEAASLTLGVEVHDAVGLKRVRITVKDSTVEEVELMNGLPVRRPRGRAGSAAIPGEVQGNGKALELSIPIALKKGVQTVRVSAENTKGMFASESRTIERIKPRK